MNGQYTYTEITAQTAAWSEALDVFAAAAPQLTARWQALNPANVIFTGCGSTHYLSMTAAALFQQQTGIPARACPASELLLFRAGVLSDMASTLLVAISRSGTTTETLTAVSRFLEQGGQAVWTITCYLDSPLAQLSEIVLGVVDAQEVSMAQTRSFTSMLLLAQALAAHLGGQDWSVLRQLPDYGRALLTETESLMRQMAERADLTRFTYLGSGPLFGIASEAMIKMTEMSLTVAHAYHFLEYRHGPMSLVNEEAAILGLLSATAVTHESQVLREMAEKGAVTLALSAGHSEGDIVLPADLPSWAVPVLYLPPLQLLAYYRALAKDLDPDTPRHLTAVIYLDAAAF